MSHIKTISLLVKDYSEAVDFYTQKLGFVLKDNYPEYKWVTLKLPDQNDLEITLCLVDDADAVRVGNQTGTFPMFIVEVEDCQAVHDTMLSHGVAFKKAPEPTDYGTFAEFTDLYGNVIMLRGTSGAKHI